jgi:hypothetical protein
MNEWIQSEEKICDFIPTVTISIAIRSTSDILISQKTAEYQIKGDS